jgi:hypothetical protein
LYFSFKRAAMISSLFSTVPEWIPFRGVLNLAASF